MAREVSQFGISVDLDSKPGFVLVEQFERAAGEDGGFNSDEKTVIGRREYAVEKLHPDTRPKSDGYGLSKLLQDRTSTESKDSSRLEAMDAVYDRLCAGQWEKERESSGPTVSVEVEALALLQGVQVAVVQKALRAYTPEQREKIMSNAIVVEKAAEIRKARAEQSDTDVGLDKFVA